MAPPQPRSARVRVLRIARSQPCLNIDQIAAAARCHPRTVRKHLASRRVQPHASTTKAAARVRRCRVSCRSPDTGHQRDAVRDPLCPPAVLDRLSTSSDVIVRSDAVEHPSCPPRTVGRVLRAEDVSKPMYLAAGHRNCPVGLLAAAAASSDSALRTRVAANPNCPAALFERLAGDDWWVARAAADNPACPPRTLLALAGHPFLGVRRAVAAHPASPSAAIAVIAADRSDTDARVAALMHPGCPPQQSDTAAVSLSPAVRCAAAASPQCRPETLEALSRDRDTEVADTARRRLRDRTRRDAKLRQ